MRWVEIKSEKPPIAGKYVIKTVSKRGTKQKLEALYNGNSFDVNNQEPTHWLDEHNYVNIQN
jgi:hypothetical protein